MKVLKKEFPKLTKFQRQVVIGTLLGDAHASTNTKTRGKYSLQFCQTWWHLDYFLHLFYLFRDYCGALPYYRLSTKTWYFSTYTSEKFTFYGKYFYDSKSKKRIPKNIGRFLTPVALAYWYMDDGSIKSKQSKGVILNTHCFKFNEIELLCQVLKNKFELNAKPRKQKEGYQIYISGNSYEKFVSLVNPYILVTMKYKIPSPRKLR